MAAKLQTQETLLAPGLTLRPAQWADVDAIAKLILDVCTADGDPTVATTVEDLMRFWKADDFKLETDAWLVETSDGRIVGYEEFANRHQHAVLAGDGYVHPEYMGQGIGTAMLRALAARSREEIKLAPPDLRVYIRNGMSTKDRVGCAMHEEEGYKTIRFSWRMEITLDEAPPEPTWLAGIELRPFSLDQDRSVYEAHEDAFQDHWGHTPDTFEHWQHHMSGRADFDPMLWFIAWDTASGQIAGYSLCRIKMGIGWVGTLGVRRPWRKQGLGRALLYHSFGEFFRRDQAVVGLGVDAANPTGATRLYQKAGMQIAHEYVFYEKEFRSGREVTQEE